jgi:hypothetical protein
VEVQMLNGGLTDYTISSLFEMLVREQALGNFRLALSELQ